jgi:hypothetical protein
LAIKFYRYIRDNWPAKITRSEVSKFLERLFLDDWEEGADIQDVVTQAFILKTEAVDHFST